MNIIVNIMIILLMIFNIYNFKVAYKDVKELYKTYKDKKAKRKEIKNSLEKRKLVLYKNLQELKNIDLDTPLYGKFTQIEMARFLKVTKKLKEENETLFIFASDLLKNVKIENMRNFMKNAPYITINYLPQKEALKNGNQIKAGTYTLCSKQIDIYFDQNNTTLYHELLHAASSDFSYNVSGFHICLETGESLGKGLNEGYTELLNKRFFAKKSKSYTKLQKLAALIELFYENKEDMITDYFNADAIGLIGELLKSMSLEEAINILVEIDGFLDNRLTMIDYLKLKHKIQKLYQTNSISQKKQELSHSKKILVKKSFNKNAKIWHNLTSTLFRDIIKYVC